MGRQALGWGSVRGKAGEACHHHHQPTHQTMLPATASNAYGTTASPSLGKGRPSPKFGHTKCLGTLLRHQPPPSVQPQWWGGRYNSPNAYCGLHQNDCSHHLSAKWSNAIDPSGNRTVLGRQEPSLPGVGSPVWHQLGRWGNKQGLAAGNRSHGGWGMPGNGWGGGRQCWKGKGRCGKSHLSALKNTGTPPNSPNSFR